MYSTDTSRTADAVARVLVPLRRAAILLVGIAAALGPLVPSGAAHATSATSVRIVQVAAVAPGTQQVLLEAPEADSPPAVSRLTADSVPKTISPPGVRRTRPSVALVPFAVGAGDMAEAATPA